MLSKPARGKQPTPQPWPSPPEMAPYGVVHANVGQNVTPHNPSLGLFVYHFLHTMVS
jgi:hypothetical protein